MIDVVYFHGNLQCQHFPQGKTDARVHAVFELELDGENYKRAEKVKVIIPLVHGCERKDYIVPELLAGHA